ncbi:MAG TPA: nucleoside/nucleotide kinase family protein [Nocardioidaceae bacterium]
MARSVVVSPDGSELAGLLGTTVSATGSRRRILGLAGPPGAGKSRLAAALVRLARGCAVDVPMDGFHLADGELARQGLTTVKGAPETFDAWGYAALLQRLRDRPDHVVYVPGFDRRLEQPLAGAVPVSPEVDLVVTEGNYLLLDRPAWREVRRCIDTVWYVDTSGDLRRRRLLARHVEFGKTEAEADAWVTRVDEANARLVAESRRRADLEVDLTAWEGVPSPPNG